MRDPANIELFQKIMEPPKALIEGRYSKLVKLIINTKKFTTFEIGEK